jgi:hypothetical protein
VIKGLVLLGAVAFDVLLKSRQAQLHRHDHERVRQQGVVLPVRANEAPGHRGLLRAAAHQDSVPEGVPSESSVIDAPTSGTGRE